MDADCVDMDGAGRSVESYHPRSAEERTSALRRWQMVMNARDGDAEAQEWLAANGIRVGGRC